MKRLEEEKQLEELFPSLCTQVLLLGEQHTGKEFYDPAEAEEYLTANLGVLLACMAAASEAKINLITVVLEARNKWQSASISTPSTKS